MLVEKDYGGTGTFPLTFRRFYNSQDNRIGGFGRGWRAELSRGIRKDSGFPPAYSSSSQDNSTLFNSRQEACQQGWPQIRARSPGLASATATFANGTCTLKEGVRTIGSLDVRTNSDVPPPKPPTIAIYADREDGSSHRFIVDGTTLIPPAGSTARLVQTAGGYRYTDNGIVEEYNSDGVLLSIRNEAGVTQTLVRQIGLVTVADSSGRSITLTFNAGGKPTKLVDPDGKEYLYAYNSNGDLETVTDPALKVRRYHYENAAFPRLVTGVTDENLDRFATYTYDAMGRARISEHAGGVDRVEVTYNADGTATVKDALNAERIYEFEQIASGRRKVSDLSEPCGSCISSVNVTFDTNGFPASRTDRNSNLTTYVFNPRGFEESRTEAVGTAQQRTISTQWHASYRRPIQVDEPGRQTVYTYDANGNRLTETVIDTATNESRTTTWTYNALGQVLTVNGPRSDVSDVTTYTYGAQGNLATITNALGQVTQITDYDAHGNPESVTDPNGIVTTLTYDLRQRLKTRTVAGASTSFDYDGVGQLIKVTLPDGSFLSYTYDAAHRLTDIQDNAGNKIHYTLDLLGNRTKEEVFDPSNSLKRAQSQVFNALGRLQQIKNASNQVVSEFGYDNQGNRTSRTDAGAYVTGSTFDALNRLTQVTDAGTGITQYGLNALDQLTSVTDPKNLTTTYTLNALGDVTQQASPDTGATSYTLDAAGNRTSQTDARGVAVGYSFDALNRLTFVDYPGTAEDVSYFYDGSNYPTSIPNGIGRLTGIQDESGTTTVRYDARGNVTQEQRVIGSATYITGYSYSSADRLTTINYPTGRLVSYERNSLGQVSKVTTTVAGVTTTLADSITYLPFGGIGSYTLGNGVAVTRTHDLDYRLDELKDQGTATVQDLKLYYDLRSNIDAIEDLVDTGRSQTLDYDYLSRLTSAEGAYGLHGITYDGVGNRLTRSITPPGGSAATDTYTYPATSHRLSSIAGANPASFSHEDAGNVTAKSGLTLSYNAAHRAVTVSQGTSTVANVYNAAGQRASKTTSTSTLTGTTVTTVRFHHDLQGHLLAETDAEGNVLREYVYLEGTPLALQARRKPVANSAGAGAAIEGLLAGLIGSPPPQNPAHPQPEMFYFHTDHLGTPQKLTDQAQQIAWNARYEPFGRVSLDTELVVQPLRFPGQYFDAETGLHQNWNRDYDPSIGRYLQSDPVGLEGGINTYAYVGSNPLVNVDPEGLDYWIEGAAETEQKCPEQGCGAHQSFCVGKPGGKRFCTSFGRMAGQGWCFVNCRGHVYQDKSPAGPMDPSSYRTSSAADDAAIEKQMRSERGTQARYDFMGAPGNNCRSYSQRLFDRIDAKFKGGAASPPGTGQ